MRKAIVIGDEPQQLPAVEVLAIVAPGADALAALAKYQPELVVMSAAVAKQLNQNIHKNRTTVAARTHQGIQLVQREQIYYFQAEHKYVVAHHSQGQLLIDESLNGLEQEFADNFLRIHRNTLVACKYIEAIYKNAEGKYLLKLRGINKEFPVSRRQLPKVRKILGAL